jgi:photosystem II stability/assembly factor-like uncharacterized protein
VLTRIARMPRKQRLLLALGASLAVGAAAGAVVVTSGGGSNKGFPAAVRAQVGVPVLTSHVRDAQLVTPAVGWALTTRLLRTTNGGSTWADIAPQGLDAARIRAVSFLDPSHGWLLTSRDVSPDAAQLVVYRTSDGGRSWSSAAVGRPSGAEADAVAAAASFDFLDPRHGWLSTSLASSAAFSRGELFATSDGGATWSALTIPIGAPVDFQNTRDGWTAGGVSSGQLYVTHDGGSSWRKSDVSAPAGDESAAPSYELPTFVNGQLGALPVAFVRGAQSELAWYRTDDGGVSWTLTKRFPVGESLELGTTLPTALSPDGAWIVALGRGHSIGVVTNRGESSSERTTSGLPITAQSAVTKLGYASTADGWALVSGSFCGGFKTDCSSYEALFRTTDGGSSWSQLRPS